LVTWAISRNAAAQFSAGRIVLNTPEASSVAAPETYNVSSIHFTGQIQPFVPQPAVEGMLGIPQHTPSVERILDTQQPFILPHIINSVEPWHLQHMPDGLLYGSYLAGPRESRIGTAVMSNSNGDDVWDTTLGGRVGLLRWGTADPHWAEGWQLDVEGAAFPRLNAEHRADVDATDFRVGVPLTYRQDQWQFKAAFYHLSSHVGDEFLVRNPSFQRINYSRNAFVLGAGYFPTPDLRFYGEVEYGFFNDDGSEPWAVQFGFDLAPSQPTGLRGTPFLAANVWLREEVDFGGTLTLMTGWSWRSDRNNHLCRLGLQYSDGHTSQLEFHDQHEQLVGLGLWYDF